MKAHSKAAKGYTLVEVLVGLAILSIAIGTATMLASTSSEVEARNREIGRAHSIIEAAHNLYQLGFDRSEIPGKLPYDPLVTITINDSNIGSNAALDSALDLSFEAVSITGTIQITGGESIPITIESIRENAAYR